LHYLGINFLDTHAAGGGERAGYHFALHPCGYAVLASVAASVVFACARASRYYIPAFRAFDAYLFIRGVWDGFAIFVAPGCVNVVFIAGEIGGFLYAFGVEVVDCGGFLRERDNHIIKGGGRCEFVGADILIRYVIPENSADKMNAGDGVRGTVCGVYLVRGGGVCAGVIFYGV
jgi:hypothetical protein